MRAFLALAVAVVAAVPVFAQQATFRAGAQIVFLPTMVTEADGRLVPDLDKDDFVVLDNGKPQELSVFESSTQPFTAVVALDFSGSMTNSLDLLKDAAEQFLLRLLPQDKAQVGSFADRVTFSGTFTSDRDDLIGALRDLDFGNATRLWDAVDESINLLDGAENRKVVVVFTDGDDTASRNGFGRVMDKARQNDVMVYAIGLESVFFNGARMERSRPDRSLKKIADETGGGYFELKKTDQLAPTFTRVAQELHSLYTLGFSPAVMDGKEHKLEVRVKKPGMTARARRSYVAAPEKLSGQ
jgi:Ca-activated chloride channel family protein